MKKMTKEQYNLSFFDVACEKHGFLRNYIHYLPPSRIEMILLVCEPYMNKKLVCERLNEKPNKYRDYTPSRLDAALNIIRGKLFVMQAHAKLFGIADTIKAFSTSQLKRLVEEQEELEKASEND